MTFRVSGQNMDIGGALRGRIAERLDGALGKYFDGTASGHAVVRKDGSFFTTECVMHLSSGITLQAEGRSADPYASADVAAGHIEKRLRRYKRKLKEHRPDRAAPTPAMAYVLAAPDQDAETEEAEAGDYHPVVIAESETTLRTYSVGEAVEALDLGGAQLVVFRHAANGRVNIVYRRPDGNVGWIDPTSGSAS